MAKTPILPNLPILTEQQKSRIPGMCNKWALDNLLHYLETGEITFSDLPELEPVRKAALEQKLEAWRNLPEPPDPQELLDWQCISEFGRDLRYMQYDERLRLKSLLDRYISSYAVSKPGGNHLDDANSLLNEINKEEERDEWVRVPKDFDSIKSYMFSHPSSPFGFEAEEQMWNLAQSSVLMLNTFVDTINYLYGRNVSLQSQGNIVSQHLASAQVAANAYEKWNNIRQSSDIFEVCDYLQTCPQVLQNEVRNLYDDLKRNKFRDFKNHLSDTGKMLDDVDDFFRMIDGGIITVEESINAGIISRKSFELLNKRRTETLNLTLGQNAVAVHPDGVKATDVFLFGIPSTGKTCVVMGLMGLMGISDKVIWDVTNAGGKYGKQLHVFLENGALPQRTTTNFVTLISGKINDRYNPEVKHPVNIVDMAGEAFAERIANNPDCEVAFEDMGIGATELLKSDNDKVFFIVVDPTTEKVSFDKELEDGSVQMVECFQHDTLLALCNLFANKKNASIMSKVKAINLITTKSDMLGSDPVFVAKDKIRGNYKDVLSQLKDICKESKYAINRESNYLPKLYTFSLGKFYLGGIYDYDSKDAEKLISVIENSTRVIREETFVDKIRNVLNKSI